MDSPTQKLSPVNLKMIVNAFLVFGVCLKIMAEWLNHVEVIPMAAMRQLFEQYNQTYLDFHAAWERRYRQQSENKTAPDEEAQFVKEFLEKKEYLLKEVCEWLGKGDSYFRDEALKNTCKCIITLLKQFNVSSSKQRLKQRIEDQLKSMLDTIQQKKKIWLEKTPKKIEELWHWLTTAFDEKTAGEVQRLQNKIYTFDVQYGSFTYLFNPDEVIEMQAPLGAYTLLMSALAIFQSKVIVERQQSHRKHTEQIFQNYCAEARGIRLRLGSLFEETLRTQRILDAHQQWSKILGAAVPTLMNNPVKTARLLTVQKKKFYKHFFAQQKAHFALHQLQTFVSHQTGYPSGRMIYQALLANKQRILAHIQQQETHVQTNQNRWQRLIAQCTANLVYHTSYQKGNIGNQMIENTFSATNLPILREELPEDLQQVLERLTGVTFITIDILSTQWIGSSYQLISFLNNFLFLQVDALFKMGVIVDSPVQQTIVPLLEMLEQRTSGQARLHLHHLKEFVRTDELGMIGKEEFIHWTTGLGINAMIATLASGFTAAIPATVGYLGATFCRTLMLKLLDHYRDSVRVSDKTWESIKFFTQLLVYSYAYTYGVRLGSVYFQPPSVTNMSDAEALKVFGFHQGCREQALKDKYREWARRNHPDKCGNMCEIPMETINLAYEVLKKKCQ